MPRTSRYSRSSITRPSGWMPGAKWSRSVCSNCARRSSGRLSSSIFVGPNFVENSCHAASNDGASNRDGRRSIGADRAFRRPRREREAAALPRDPRQLGCGARVIRGEDHPDRRHDGVERRVVERQRQQVSLHPLHVGRLAARAGEHLLGEVETGHVRGSHALVGERQVAGATGPIEHAVARAHRRLGGQPPPPAVEARRHHTVHRVVDRRDPVEHRADVLGSEGHCCPQRGVSAWSSPSWSSTRATTKSTRSPTVSAPW